LVLNLLQNRTKETEMTMEEILKLSPGPEMDRLIAEKVMGWRQSKLGKGAWMGPNGSNGWADVPSYSTAIVATWDVLLHIRKWQPKLGHEFVQYLRRAILERIQGGEDFIPHSEIIMVVEPVDICKAALMVCAQEDKT
jgi:Phage ABA sandwich domain